MLKTTQNVSILALAMALGACAAPTSSSTPSAAANKLPAYTGKVFVTEGTLPTKAGYKVIGKVKAAAKSGYSGGANLYPLLADEARKLGANAVIGVTGGRKVTLLSWAAAFVEGTAIRVESQTTLKGLQGDAY